MKYELTTNFIQRADRKLYQIRALKDFQDVKAGDLGGYIEKERNLSQEGNCWVYSDAKVFNNARIFDNAKVYGDAKVFNNAWVGRNSKISGNTEIN